MNKELLKKNFSFLEKISKEFTFLESAEFLPNGTIEIITSNDNLRASATNRFKSIYSLSKEEQNKINFTKLTPFPQQFDLTTTSYSPTYTYMAAVQSHPGKFDDNKKKRFLEIYNNDSLIDTLNIDDFHEEILKGTIFGKTLIWNKQENKIMYLAKLKEPKKQSFWENQLDDKQIEEAYNTPKLIADYGEQLENIYEIGLFIYNLETKTLEQILLPDNFLPFYPQFFDPAGESIILVGTPNEQNFKLGCVFCNNRQCTLYLLDKNCLKETLYPKKKEEKEEEKEKKETPKPKLTDLKAISTDAIATFPKVSPDLEKIAYFSSPMQNAHQFNMELKIYDKKTEQTKTVIPIYNKIDEKLKFAGITGQQAKFFWFENSKHGLLNSHVDNDYHFYLIDTATNEIKLISPVIENRKTLNTIFAINKFNNDVIFKSTNFKNIIELHLLTGLNFKENDMDSVCKNLKIHKLQYQSETSALINQFKKILATSKETKLTIKNSSANGMLYSLTDYSTEYLNIFDEKAEIQIIPDCKKPLIVIIHGGPHSTPGGFTLLRLIFLLKGYNVLVPNYTGTLGYGQDFVTGLLGKISVLEFNEITELISKAIEQKLCDPEKIFPMGGSNGGYLTGLLAGKENNFNIKFKGGILLNPVLNLAYSAIASDIIDWTYAECFNRPFENYNFTPADYAKMYEQSPMNYPSKIPLLILLGKVDRRVPYHQGLAYTVQCQRNNQTVETFVYPKSNHALSDSLNTDYEVMLRTINFIDNSLLIQ